MKRLMLVALSALLALALAVPVLADGHGPQVRAVHASPDAPAVDIWVNGAPAFTNAPFTGITPYAMLSEGLNNFQIVTFGDVGTAWTGWNPYSKDNILYRRTVDDGPLHIEYEVEKEPIVAGMGFGVRSRLLGYFVRADWAWGLEDGVLGDNIFYISLSLDF